MFSNDSPQICDCLLRNFPAAGFIIPASLEQSFFRGQLPPPSFALPLSLPHGTTLRASRAAWLAGGRGTMHNGSLLSGHESQND